MAEPPCLLHGAVFTLDVVGQVGDLEGLLIAVVKMASTDGGKSVIKISPFTPLPRTVHFL